MYNYKRDCFWFDEQQDMQARIYFCDWHTTESGDWELLENCTRNCEHYISTEEAKTIINSWQKNNRKK